MANRKVWLTWMPSDEVSQSPQEIISKLTRYGLATQGAPWVDDLPRMAWAKTGETLLDPDSADAWIIAGNLADFQKESNRVALSLLAAMLGESRKTKLPMFALCLDAPADQLILPLLASRAIVLSTKNASWPAKIVAGLARFSNQSPLGFRLSVHAHPMIGQFLEVGPASEIWDGAMVGVSGEGKITHHAVGPSGEVPERGVVEFELSGIKAEVSGKQFVAWAVKNQLNEKQSYYLRVDGPPDSILVGGYPGEGADQEVTLIALA